MNLHNPVNYIARKILYFWIKTDVLHYKNVLKHADKNTAIVYVLDDHSWANLLVLEQECERLHLPMPLAQLTPANFKYRCRVYTLAKKRPLKAWLKNNTRNSPILLGLLGELKFAPEQDIQFIPVTIFWGRPIAKQKHWLSVLFSDTWGIAGRSRRFFTILFNGKDTLVQFSDAISFRKAIKPSLDDATIIDNIQQHLSTRLNTIKTATLGPDVSHRRTLIRTLLNTTEVQAKIKKCSVDDNLSEYQATRRAQKYLTEIVANCNYIAIQLLQRTLRAFWHKFYSGITVKHSKKLNRIARSHELIYVPCHRSHIDYLLLSYVIHSEGLAIPYIAAGKNLNMPIIGSILRKGGAFFIRRTFKDNELYSTVMFEYLASLINCGMPIEYFIEGGRSRSGRLLKPKPGMLAMTIRAFLKYRQRPVAFIPVNINYEKMVEGHAYLAELEGDNKKTENLFGSIRAFFKIRGNYGRVTTSFGKPVYLNDMLNSKAKEWENDAYNDAQQPEWLMPVVKATATKIMHHINQASHVNSINLISTALLATGNQAMDEGELLSTLNLYIALIHALNFSDYITVTQINAKAQIHRAEKLNLVKRRHHEMGDFIYLDRPMAILLTYYRNNTLHLLALPSLIACCFTNTSTIKRARILHLITVVYPFLKAEMYLVWDTDNIEQVTDIILNQLCQAGLLIKNYGPETYSKPRISSLEHTRIQSLANVISPVLELYYIIFALLANQSAAAPTRDTLEHQCYLMAQRISLIHEINSPDFFDKKLISNFIDSLIELDYVITGKQHQLIISQQAIEKGRNARHLLDKNIQYNILQMLHATNNAAQ